MGLGNIHWAVRWKTVRLSTPSAMAGAIWKPLAPAPIMATLCPERSTEWSHRAEWKEGPAQVSRPGMSGMWGRLSWPTAEITARASRVDSVPSPARVRTVQVPVRSSQAAPRTSVLHRTWGSMAYLCITDSKYACSSGCRAKYSVHVSVGSKL